MGATQRGREAQARAVSVPNSSQCGLTAPEGQVCHMVHSWNAHNSPMESVLWVRKLRQRGSVVCQGHVANQCTKLRLIQASGPKRRHSAAPRFCLGLVSLPRRPSEVSFSSPEPPPISRLRRHFRLFHSTGGAGPWHLCASCEQEEPVTSCQTYDGLFLPLLLCVPTQLLPLSEPRLPHPQNGENRSPTWSHGKDWVP